MFMVPKVMADLSAEAHAAFPNSTICVGVELWVDPEGRTWGTYSLWVDTLGRNFKGMDPALLVPMALSEGAGAPVGTLDEMVEVSDGVQAS